ncbi:MAG TPA: M56 family metallopeptidase [Terriglobales bacterium]|nr:M56 family metallopeptidase [Terriglobales bacterium]
MIDFVARMAAERMVNSVAAGVVLTALAWSLLRLVPRTNARTRTAVWLSVLMAIPALSLAAIFVPGTPNSLVPQSARIIISEGWASAFFIVWSVLATVALLRVAFGLWRIRCLRRVCAPVNSKDLDPAVLVTINEFRPKRRVALLASETARVPMAVGFFRPAVILPSWVLTDLSASEISAILIHEFAHLRRWDDWTNFFQKLVRAIFFFHPSIWWLDRRLALDREVACDDAVLAATDKAHDYARCLLGLAERSLTRRSLAMAQAAVHRLQHISVRISQILDSSRPRATRISKIALGAVTALVGLCLVAVLQSPTLIAFRNSDVVTAALHRNDDNSEAAWATVIPAMLREPTSTAPSSFPHLQKSVVGTAASRVRRNDVNVIRAHAKPRDVVIPAKFTPRPKPQPKVLRAGLSVERQVVIPVESILFVMPDAIFDGYGRVVWTLSVWRLTVFHPVRVPAEGAISNSI